ncbi:hypothetical protein D3C87_1645930 [compost metagenome]
MHHDIKTKLQRAMNHRRGKGIIRHADDVVAARDLRNSGEIGQFQQGIGRRFHPNHFGLGADGRVDPGKVAGLHPAHLQA